MFSFFRKFKAKQTKNDTSGAEENSEKDYYIENGLMVFTERYHLKRGYCCNSGCRHCPYKNKKG